MRVLDLGCGRTTVPGAIGIDIVRMEGVDVVADLRQGIPIKNEVINNIRCNSFVEHLQDVVFFMEEVYRVLKPDGIVEITVPYYTSNYAVVDPTHCHYFSYNTFDYFTNKSTFKYSRCLFQIMNKRLKFANGKLNCLNRFIDPLINRFPGVYEKLFAHIVPSDGLTVVMKKLRGIQMGETDKAK